MKNTPAGRAQNGTSGPCLDLLYSVGLCHPGWESVARLTFQPMVLSKPAWQDWKEKVFLPLLRPQLEKALAACATGDGRSVEICDQVLEKELLPSQAKLSRAAGALLAGEFTAPSAERLWLRARNHIIAGQWPGHLATVVALRAATFHLPPLQVVGSYLLLEARGAFGRTEMPLCQEMVNDCLAEGPSVPLLRVA